MSIFNSRARYSKEVAPWNRPPEVSEGVKIHAPTAAEAYEKAGQVAFQGVMRAGEMLITAEGSIAANHPSVPPEVKAQAPEASQDDVA
jgi:hypothetical protein